MPGGQVTHIPLAVLMVVVVIITTAPPPRLDPTLQTILRTMVVVDVSLQEITVEDDELDQIIIEEGWG